MAGSQSKKDAKDRWGYFAALQGFLAAFPHATAGQKASVAAMGFLSVMFIGLGLVGSVTLPAWAVVTMFVVATILIFSTAVMLLWIERAVTAPLRCRPVPIFPPDQSVRTAIRAALDEIRQDAADAICKKIQGVTDDDIRANIFLLAKIEGGKSWGQWKLVIHNDLAVNMNHPAERHLQFAIGQGATGVAYRDGTYQLTRREQTNKGQWDLKFQMTPQLEAQLEARLKWIVSFPLLKPNTTTEPLGVLNIDGLVDVQDDELLNKLATSIRGKVDVIAATLSLQPSTCVGIDELGVMEHA
jgi:hypothetical protein